MNKQINSSKEINISILDLLVLLARQIKIMILLPIITCFLGVCYAVFMTTPVFISSAKITSSLSSGSTAGSAVGIAAQFGLNLGSNSGEKFLYPTILQSRTFARKILNRKFDTVEFGKNKTLLAILTYGNEEKPIADLEPTLIAGVKSFLGMISVSEVSPYFDLSIKAKEPKFAQNVLTAVIEELDKHQKEYNNAITKETRLFIEGRIKQIEKELNFAEESVRDFRASNRRIENSPSLQLELSRLQREVTVLIGVFSTLKQQLETTKIEEYKESDYVMIIDPPDLPLKKSKPNKRAIVILATLFGLGLGVMLGFAERIC